MSEETLTSLSPDFAQALAELNEEGQYRPDLAALAELPDGAALEEEQIAEIHRMADLWSKPVRSAAAHVCATAEVGLREIWRTQTYDVRRSTGTEQASGDAADVTPTGSMYLSVSRSSGPWTVTLTVDSIRFPEFGAAKVELLKAKAARSRAVAKAVRRAAKETLRVGGGIVGGSP
ncbi:MAG: hypothetical protein AAFP22_22840 [Planctomycetota bacterium]